MKNMEYKEPEFNVVMTSVQDVLTASPGAFDPSAPITLGAFETNAFDLES